MKKLLLGFGMLAAAAVLLVQLHRNTAAAARAAADAHRAWLSQTQLLAQARAKRTSLQRQLKERREESTLQSRSTSPVGLERWAWETNRTRLSSEESERLLAELGFNWHNQPDYVVVSKGNLKRLILSGLRGTKLTEAACQVLAITPEERAALEATARQLGAESASWTRAHLQRDEPSGDVLAKYTIEPDPAFSLSLSNRFTQALYATLGPERGQLLRSYAGDWMDSTGMGGGEATTLTISRSGDSLSMQLRQSGGLISGTLAQPFPAAFRPAFPGGWAELARREGFELP